MLYNPRVCDKEVRLGKVDSFLNPACPRRIAMYDARFTALIVFLRKALGLSVILSIFVLTYCVGHVRGASTTTFPY